MELKRIGIDLAKQVFQLHGIDSHEQVVCRQPEKSIYAQVLRPQRRRRAAGRWHAQPLRRLRGREAQQTPPIGRKPAPRPVWRARTTEMPAAWRIGRTR